MSDIKLYLGDCLEYMRSMPDESVDAVVTDPPYGTGKLATNGASYKVKPKREYYEWDTWDDSWMQLVNPKCFAVFTPPQQLPEMLKQGRLLACVSKQGVCVKNVSPVYRLQPIVLIGQTPVNYVSDWYEFIQDGQRKNHPTEKSLNVMEWLVKMTTNEGDTVFDPFMGSGTTGVACVKLNRNFIGCEINPDYFKIAEQRITQAQADLGQVARPLSNRLTQQNAF